MGGDDSQEAPAREGSQLPLQGANLRLNYEINTVTETAPHFAHCQRACGSATGCLGHFWKAQVGQFWRAPKHVPVPVEISVFRRSFEQRK